MFMLLRVEIHPGLRLGGEFENTATLPLPWAAEEAWMSINTVLVTAARLRFGMNVKGCVWAAARDGER
jgi:hypothetical protein